MKQYKPDDEVYYLDSRNPVDGNYPNVIGPCRVLSDEGSDIYYVVNPATGRKCMLYSSQIYDNAEDAGEASMNWI
jgi:hypothetical protein